MSDALSASRKSLEAERQKALDEVKDLDTRIEQTEIGLGLLRDRRNYLSAKADQLGEGIAALRKAAADGQV
jgi:hypothetical protein